MIRFTNGVFFSGTWCFTADEASDYCEIIGSIGTIRFSFFNKQEILLTRDGQTTEFTFDPLAHVQQPMIAEVVNYFSGKASNPCSGEEGALIMSWLEQMTSK
jgi:predicted dehydrogenase